MEKEKYFTYNSKYVDTEKIRVRESDDGKNRYVLTISFKENKNRSLAVIMKNPSEADNEQSDFTVNKILKFAHENDYSKVHILNLYSYRAKDSKMLKKLIKSGEEEKAVGMQNDLWIKAAIKNVESIIIAWGTSPNGMKKHYDARIKTVLEILKGKKLSYVFEDYSNSDYPRHPQYWANKAATLKIAPWKNNDN